MVNQTLQDKLNQYTEIYTVLKEEFKWKVSDKRTLMIIASMYVVNAKTFDLERLRSLSEYIKKEVGFFSILKSYHRFTIASMLDIRFDQPKEKFHELIGVYELLVSKKFARGSFTYLSALIMLSDESLLNREGEKVDRVLAIYKGMKSRHRFLTSSNDYPLAVLLAELEGDVEILMDRIEGYYQKLNEVGFKKGNDLQFMSHIMSLNHHERSDILIERCSNVYDAFKQYGLKTNAMHYPLISLLSYLKDGEKEVEMIRNIVYLLNKEKQFKSYKNMNLIMAVNFLMSERIKDSKLLETGIYTTIETIIQAQQAALIASVAGASAAASSSAGS